MTTNEAAPAETGSAVPFSRATAVRARRDGGYDAEASPEWAIAGRPNGGYLAALLGRVATELTGPAHVVACSAHFLRSPEPGPVELYGEVLRRGRAVNQVRTRLVQGGKACVEALVSTGSLDDAAPRFDANVPVVEPVPFEAGTRLEPVSPDGFRVPMLDQVDMRLDPAHAGLSRHEPSGGGRLSGWIELLGEPGFDPLSLLFAVDAFPPATLDTAYLSWAPTVELTTYVRALPAPGPVRVHTRARLVQTRWVDETCDVWDTTGRLVAQATQLATIPG